MNTKLNLNQLLSDWTLKADGGEDGEVVGADVTAGR
jgi:hypothetical protein